MTELIEEKNKLQILSDLVESDQTKIGFFVNPTMGLEHGYPVWVLKKDFKYDCFRNLDEAIESFSLD